MKKSIVLGIFSLFILASFVLAETNSTCTKDSDCTVLCAPCANIPGENCSCAIMKCVNNTCQNNGTMTITHNDTALNVNNTSGLNNSGRNNNTGMNVTANRTNYNLTGPWGNRCLEVTNRVNGRIRMYVEARDPHLNRFNNIVNILERNVNRSEEKGYDTTKLKADIVTLKEKIQKFRGDYDVFITKLNDTRVNPCSRTENLYQERLREAKLQLRIVRQDIDDIKQFYNEVVKGSIKQLREQKKITNSQKRGGNK